MTVSTNELESKHHSMGRIILEAIYSTSIVESNNRRKSPKPQLLQSFFFEIPCSSVYLQLEFIEIYVIAFALEFIEIHVIAFALCTSRCSVYFNKFMVCESETFVSFLK